MMMMVGGIVLFYLMNEISLQVLSSFSEQCATKGYLANISLFLSQNLLQIHL
jgi:hypothetical protein